MRYFWLLWLMLSLVVLQSVAQAQTLMSHADVSIAAPTWTYTVFNDEAVGSSNFVGYFTLTVQAPFTVLGTPSGWDFQTDNSSFVQWFNTDLILPYPHDIAPGDSLSGFIIGSSESSSQLVNYDLSAWDHTLDAPGSSVSGRVLSPSTPVLTPEPSSISLLFAALMPGTWVLMRRFYNKQTNKC